MSSYTTTRRIENAFEKRRLPASACFCFFLIRRGTLPYSVEDDASTISQTPTTHYTNNTCVKLTIITHLSVSERIAIANLSLLPCYMLYYIVSVLFLLYVWCPCMAINVSVQYNAGLLPDIKILLTQCYYHRGTRLNAMKRFCICSL